MIVATGMSMYVNNFSRDMPSVVVKHLESPTCSKGSQSRGWHRAVTRKREKSPPGEGEGKKKKFNLELFGGLKPSNFSPRIFARKAGSTEVGILDQAPQMSSRCWTDHDNLPQPLKLYQRGSVCWASLWSNTVAATRGGWRDTNRPS